MFYSAERLKGRGDLKKKLRAGCLMKMYSFSIFHVLLNVFAHKILENTNVN